MAENEAVKSTCGLCFLGCGILIHLEDGRPVRIEGDPDSPVNEGKLCTKGLASLEYLHSPDRLKHSLKRVGERGEGKWQRISWDEALDTIAEELSGAKESYGAESVAMIQGSAKGFQNAWLHRLGRAFGTPNIAGQGHVCHRPRSFASVITCGFASGFANPGYDAYPPSCIVVWGLNSEETNTPMYRETLRAIDRNATRLMVIDPRSIGLTSRADLWLRLRPGSDLALALGMINIIINEGLFDKVFVDNWTVGFDKLRAHIQDYTPERVADMTWIDANTIRQAARLYAENRPACIEWGNAFDNNINSLQAGRAISILRAITGNLGVPGGEAQWSQLPIIWWNSPDLELFNKLPPDVWQRRLGADSKPLPVFRYIIPQNVVKAVVEEDPYPIRVVYIQGCNSLVTHSNTQETYSALKKVHFLAVADMFMTPTAALADIVLPVPSYLEFDEVVAPANVIAQVQQKVAQVGECRSDYQIMTGLAKRLGLGEYFWDNNKKAMDYILKPAGLTFDEFRKIRAISGTRQYRKYERDGFETPSGKVELYSSRLEEWGLDPLPTYHELPETPYSDPELAKGCPLILTTRKSAPFRHSGGKQIATLRGMNPEPFVAIHPETASNLGIKEGDRVYIENKRGRIKQKAHLATDLDPRVIGAAYGWWFPEKGPSESYGWAESNINVLTDNKPPFSRELGSANLRGILCKVYKA